MDGQDGSDTLIGGGGGDVLIDTGATGTDTVTYFESAVGVRVTVDDSAANDGANGGAEGDSVPKGFERIQGSAFDDIIEGGPAAKMINGSAGNDQLDGKGGANRLEGNEGEEQDRPPGWRCSPVAGLRLRVEQDARHAGRRSHRPGLCRPRRRRGARTCSAPPGEADRRPAAPRPPRFRPSRRACCWPASRPPASRAHGPARPPSAYGWFTPWRQAPSRPASLATGRRTRSREADEGRLVFCVELATNAAGSVSGALRRSPR